MAVTGPRLSISAVHAIRSASTGTAARSRGANRSSTSGKRPSRTISATAVAVAAGSVLGVITTTFLMICDRYHRMRSLPL
jgi:hypothetical protein